MAAPPNGADARSFLRSLGVMVLVIAEADEGGAVDGAGMIVVEDLKTLDGG